MTDSASSDSSRTKTVMVTGANGFLASYIVRELLEIGHTVHACVRDASRADSVAHLKQLPGADTGRLKLFSTGDLATSAERLPFDVPMEQCHAVMHVATPLSVKFGSHSGEHDIYQPAMASTQELLNCIERHKDSVKCLVLTSSMAAVAPQPEPTIKDESHWSDPTYQRERDNWYGCTKTSQEQLVRNWFRHSKTNGKIEKDFSYAAICPTMVIGPKLQTLTATDAKENGVGGTMGTLQKWCRGARSQAPNDSMSFIHVEDCAKMHTRILAMEAGEINNEQRYMSLIESLHWNDILPLLKGLYPKLPDYKLYEGEDRVTPTRFNLDNMNSLQVLVRSTRQAMQESVDYLVEVGALD